MIKKVNCYLAVILLLGSILLGTFAVSAENAETQIPYTSYTYWTDISNERKSVYSRPMYTCKCVFDAKSLGVEPFTVLNDVCTDDKGNVYILDNESRIVVLDSSYRFLYEIRNVEIQGKTEDFKGAKSIYVHTDGMIFLCDTDNHRVLCLDQHGKVLDTYLLPDSPLIPNDFEFRPMRVVKDSHDYVYILSDGSYYGAMLYDEEKQFTGFFGANEVTTGIATKLQNIFGRVFVNNKKKSASVRSLPYCFVDIVINKDDFVYTATGKTETNDRTGQIKKLNPGTGTNILDSKEVNFTDDKINITYNNGTPIEQNVEGLAVNSDGFIFCIDSQFGRIFLYDSDCRMLSAFGGGLGEGSQKGTFVAARGIALNGDDVIVGDSLNNNLTVFSVTDYGKQVMSLIGLTKNGEYEQAKAGWESILAEDRNFQPAYSGLARAYLTQGDYKQAMDLSKEGYDRETYQLAFELYRKNIIREWFWAMFTGALLLIAGLIVVGVILSRKGIRLIRSEEVRLMLRTPLHPVYSFDDIKEKNKGSIGICLVLVLLFYVTAVLQVLCGGFLFTQYDPQSFNSIWVLVRSAGIVVFWIISNWMICTLMQGKGKLREIAIVTCYSLTPIIVERVIRLVLSNVLIPSEAVFLNGLDVIAALYTLVLIVIGLIRIHEFSMSRLIGTSIMSLAWMAVMIFLIVLVAMLVQQLGGFFGTLFIELSS